MSALTGIKVSLVAGVHWVRCIVLAMLAHLREREPRLLMVKEERKRDKEVNDEAIFFYYPRVLAWHVWATMVLLHASVQSPYDRD